MKRSMKSKGFSLIELLISLVILSIALLGMAGLMSMATTYNANGGRLTEAATFAQNTLERLQVTPYTNVISGTDVITGPNSSNGTQYTRNWTAVQNATDTLRTITVTVSWSDRVPHSISIRSVVVRPRA